MTLATQTRTGTGPGVAGAVSGAGGLVPSKTNRFCVSFAPNIVAERRISRLKKSVWASGHLHGLAENGFRPSVCWFVTLTYRGVHDWQAQHITKAVEGFRHWCQRNGHQCRYTWVAELQGRGAVHYHLLAWLPPGVSMPHWDKPKGRRAAFWPHGMSNTEKARSGVGYLMKYLSKLGEFHRFPKGLRLYGIGGLNDTGRKVRAWFNLPEWAKNGFGVGELVRKAGRLLVSATGEILAPAYEVSRMPAGMVLRQLRPLPERFHDGAYSAVSFA